MYERLVGDQYHLLSLTQSTLSPSFFTVAWLDTWVCVGWSDQILSPAKLNKQNDSDHNGDFCGQCLGGKQKITNTGSK